MYATDLPTVITSAVRDGETKTIRHDRGCSAAPPELSQLEQRIDEVVVTASGRAALAEMRVRAR